MNSPGPRWPPPPPAPPAFAPMDRRNTPAPFKRYPGAPLTRLPTNVLDDGVGSARLDLRSMARLLFLSAGVTRVAVRRGGRTHYRAAASAGNLHPLECYLVAGDLGELDPGIYHFAPDAFALERLLPGDRRAVLADAVASPDVAARPASLVLSGIPWRTAWKYAARGWRHVYWDAGTMLANLLAAADEERVPVQLLFGFQDAAVARLLGLATHWEFPVVVAAVGPPTEDAAPPARGGAPLTGSTRLSPAPVEFPLVTAAQAAGDLVGAEAVRSWRASSGGGLAPFPWPPGGLTVPARTTIRRRGSTRTMRRVEVPPGVLHTALEYSARPVPVDALPPRSIPLTYLVSVHAVEGYEPGHYEWLAGRLAAIRHLPAAVARATARHLCLDQALGGDAAYALFVCADLDSWSSRLGDRGYRVAQAEAGVVVGRLQLAAYTLGLGATGLTFYDDEVARAFGTTAACMLVCAVGVPGYPSVLGGTPGRPARLG